jgi:hypothetical protein
LLVERSFLAHQIPVQEFEIETAQKPDRELQFSLNNMALATANESSSELEIVKPQLYSGDAAHQVAAEK